MRNILILLSAVFLVSCGFGNLCEVKKNANATWEAQGFKVVGYDGYEIGSVIPFTSYGGAIVWYRLKRIPDNGILYNGAIQRWGNEYHIYSVSAVDAIKP